MFKQVASLAGARRVRPPGRTAASYDILFLAAAETLQTIAAHLPKRYRPNRHHFKSS